jgi:hypothetical protein
MTSARRDTRAVALLSLMLVLGVALLAIPWLMTPPAYLDVALRDAVFGVDLSKHHVSIVDDRTGKTLDATIRKIGNAFVARVGRINSGQGTYTARITGYKPAKARVNAAALQNVRVPVDVTPAFGRLEISTVNATRRDQPVAATVKDGTRVVAQDSPRTIVLDLPPGTHRLSANAPGFCPTDREFVVREGKVTKGTFPLSPDLTADEIARFVLGWRNEPRDLDSHFRKSDALGFPHPAHLYWRQKTGSLAGGAVFARLDVDELYPGKYETVTVRANAAGDYQYFVHLYDGSGTINDADPVVQVYTRGCQMRTFTPPPGCSDRIWNVTSLRDENGTVKLTEHRTCGPATGPSIDK